MLTLSNVALPLDAQMDDRSLAARAAKILGIDESSVASCSLTKRSVDARKKDRVHFVVSFDVSLVDASLEEALLEKGFSAATVRRRKEPFVLTYPAIDPPSVRPVVVGAGPAGLFAALFLARCGVRPLLVERGFDVDRRARDVSRFEREGVLDPRSNIQFGEGGAGTFSDGKLTTNIKNKMAPTVLQWFVEAGAPESILVEAHPHLGSDNLPAIVKAMRDEIISLGGEVRFGTRLVDWRLEEGRLVSIELEGEDGSREELAAEALVLACGHSARDVFELAQGSGLFMEQKPFSVGVRIEHPQELINVSQWGDFASHPSLGAAEYKLAVHLPNGRSVYTFCMCPGGEVVAAASEEGGVVTNGMSAYARAGSNANAALLVNVGPDDFESDEVLAGVEFQRSLEQAAYRCARAHGAAPYQAPAQRVGDFLSMAGAPRASRGESSGSPVEATYGRGVVEVPLEECLPPFVIDSLAAALPLMDRRLKGFSDPDALLTAPETRSSSPVRICREKDLQARVAASPEQRSSAPASGIYPCGEGPGFAGGIMSAACDGLRVALQLALRYEA